MALVATSPIVLSSQGKDFLNTLVFWTIPHMTFALTNCTSFAIADNTFTSVTSNVDRIKECGAFWSRAICPIRSTILNLLLVEVADELRGQELSN